jgi:protein-S-isoprenylcysteine O-methyltransferase Ste14
MSNVDHPSPASATAPRKVSFGRLLLQLFLLLALLLGLLLLAAGRPYWIQAWAFSLAFFCFLLFYGIWTLRHDPAQLEERTKMGRNVRSWDKVIMSLYSVLLFMLLILSGLDGGRFRWAPVPLPMQALGWAAVILAGGLVFWVTSVNTFLSRYARLQDERGQQTVTRGPYRWIRHPMYLGVIVLMLGIPLVLESYWALVPGGLIGVLFIIRTALEDKFLQADLPGYKAYAKQVRYRLVPGIW